MIFVDCKIVKSFQIKCVSESTYVWYVDIGQYFNIVESHEQH